MNEKTKEIVKKVSAMYFEYGIRGVTMDDVAHNLGISKKTLYEYFSDKSELVSAVLEFGREEWESQFLSYNCDNCTAIDEVFHFYSIQTRMVKSNKPAFIYDLKKYYPEIFERFHCIKQELILENFKTNLKKGIREGLYREDINIDILAKLHYMRFESIMNKEYFSIDDFNFPDLFTEIFKYHIYGITTEKGRKVAEEKFNNTTNS